MRKLFGAAGGSGSNQRGNISVIFVIALLPLVSAVGCAVDYSDAMQLRSQLQAAADAASIGAITPTSPAFIAAGSMTVDGPVPAGATEAISIFNRRLSGVSGFQLNRVSPRIEKSSGSLTATIQFSAEIPTRFLSVMGKRAMTVDGSSNATSELPKFIDFYLLLDNSPSMGIGATAADVERMVEHAPDHCAFACHDLDDASNSYDLARSLGVTTRLDAVRAGTERLIDTATTMATYADQFRVAIYDFGASSNSQGLRALFRLSSNLANARAAARGIELMSVHGHGENGDQDTGLTTIFPAINHVISMPGSGTTSSPQKVLLFVSDGVADEYNTGCLKPTTAGRCQSPINPVLCTALKNRGIRIAVLYTTYLAQPGDAWYRSWIAPFNGTRDGGPVNSEIAMQMENCASPGLFVEVGPTGDISEAMTMLFRKAVADTGPGSQRTAVGVFDSIWPVLRRPT